MAFISRFCITLTVFLSINVLTSFGASKSKPHTHQGALEPYDGKHIPYSLSKQENDLLNSGKPVTINQRNGKSGRGIVIQDIHAPPHICLSKISDLPNYSKMVPNVKSIEIYDNETNADGSTRIGALFKVGVSFVTFGYYLRLKYNPKYMTYTWTLDYQYSSDFDDNTGHWQAMEHPTKEGWSRVLYSTEVKLFPWIPEFVITFLTKTALIESTTWVKRESEKQQKLTLEGSGTIAASNSLDLKPCFLEDADGNNARYETHCIDDYVSNLNLNTPPVSDINIEIETATRVESELQSDLIENTDVETIIEKNSDVGTDNDNESNAGTESGSDGDVVTKSGSDSDVVTESGSDSDVVTDNVSDSDVGTGSGSDSDVGTDNVSDSDVGTDSVSNSDVGTDSGSDSDVGTDSGSDSDVGTDSGSDSDVGTDNVSDIDIVTSLDESEPHPEL